MRPMGLDRATLGSQNVGVLGQVEVFPFLCSFARVYLLLFFCVRDETWVLSHMHCPALTLNHIQLFEWWV